jgi:PEP-CTERM motif
VPLTIEQTRRRSWNDKRVALCRSMKLKTVVCLIFWILAVTVAVARAETFISFTDNNIDHGDTMLVADYFVAYGSWTQTVATTNTSIAAILDSSDQTRHGMAYLTTAIGPGTTSSSVIASTEFTPNNIADVKNLTVETMLPLFTGLSLSPGTYYLVFQGPLRDPGLHAYFWCGDSYSDRIVAAGFTLGNFRGGGQWDPPGDPVDFPPAVDFDVAGTTYFFQVTGDRVGNSQVPEPSTMLLLGSGLIGLAGYGRNKFLKRQ